MSKTVTSVAPLSPDDVTRILGSDMPRSDTGTSRGASAGTGQRLTAFKILKLIFVRNIILIAQRAVLFMTGESNLVNFFF